MQSIDMISDALIEAKTRTASASLLNLLRQHHPEHAPRPIERPKPIAATRQPELPKADPMALLVAENATLKDQLEKYRQWEVVQPLRVRQIVKTVAEFYNQSQNDLCSGRRAARYIRPRHIAMALAKRLTSASYPQIGRALGGRDHTTIIHGVRKIDIAIQSDNELADEISHLEDMIKARYPQVVAS